MRLIDIRDAAFGWSRQTTLFRVARLCIRSGDKVILIGPNGSGKTTLFKLLSGEERFAAGEVFMRPRLAVARFEQRALYSGTVRALFNSLFREVMAVEEEIRATERRLETDWSEPLLKKYESLQSQFDSLGGYQYLVDRDSFIETFGLSDKLETPFECLSGGERQYVRLAKTLFAQCDLMLLDEPFCYLDAEKSRWLCAYLKNTPRAFVLTGHGESVQRGLTAQTIEISHGTVLMYSSDIDAARRQKSVLEQRIERKNRDVAKEIELRKQEIERRRRWMKTAEVKKPHAIVVRRMEREISQLEDMRQASLYDEDLAYGFQFQFDEERWNTNEAILEAKRVCVGFDGRTVLSDVSFQIRMYDHVFLRGANGSGKTTLLNTIAGKFQPESGSLWRKPGLRVGYFEQMFSEQYDTLTVYEYCVEHRKMGLGEYDRWKKRLFREEAELDTKRLYMLSGGERAKVELMPLLSEPVDLLMLDEPGVTLEKEACIQLIQAVNVFPGAVILTSHDEEVIESYSAHRSICV